MQNASETPLDGARRDAVSHFHPRTRRIVRHNLSPSNRHGELLLRTVAAVEREPARPPVGAAVGVELFRVYGLIRERPAPEAGALSGTPDLSALDRDEVRSAVLLAGDRVLAESFDRVAGVDRDPESVRRAVRTLARSARTLCEGQSTAPADVGTPGDARALATPGEAAALATPGEAGALATEVGGRLAEGSPPLGELRAVGRALGTAIRHRRRLSDGRDAAGDGLASAVADARTALDPLPDRVASDLGAVADALDPDCGRAAGTER